MNEYDGFDAVQFIKMVPHATRPIRATDGAVGYDLTSIAMYVIPAYGRTAFIFAICGYSVSASLSASSIIAIMLRVESKNDDSDDSLEYHDPLRIEGDNVTFYKNVITIQTRQSVNLQHSDYVKSGVRFFLIMRRQCNLQYP